MDIFPRSDTTLALSLLLALLWGTAALGAERDAPEAADAATRGRRVCPPFVLRDEAGRMIDPVHNFNDRVPYSPKQTCGAEGCHGYDKITEGYHFQQGADEHPPAPLGERAQRVRSPGNYGGGWCSPAPLYSYLSPKRNADPHLMDMTSFTFVTRGCGTCHPGGGPLEHDREGKRYDTWMADPASGLVPGGENNLDGDYHKARWSDSGILEADCMLCHLPGYSFEVRRTQLAALNFRWAATAAAGLARVEGSVAAHQPVSVVYDLSNFDALARVSPPLVVSPRNEACLSCHAQPGWKKRGADYRGRTDVHLRAGLRCVDCHPAGSRAKDPRINGREVHQIAKGDDPGGHVRDTLDNTVRECGECHRTGELGAPIALHAGFPPLHLERIACQTCHTPEKLVMPIQVQASDVFNTDALIAPGGKQLWTFYGPDGLYRNHYGILHMMGYDDKPTERFRPVLFRYKGKIFPGNRVNTAWPGIETLGQSGLMQPRMSDIHAMWKAHAADPAQHPGLSTIADDNGDGVVEVNRPEEIDSLIAATTRHLRSTGYPLDGKRVGWVLNDRVYRCGREFDELPTDAWEASPYGNVHKYNHDVQPARAALGTNGCGDCHSAGAQFFSAAVLALPFDSLTAQPVWAANHDILGVSSLAVGLGSVRESTIKPAALWVLGAVLLLLLLHAVVYGRGDTSKVPNGGETVQRFTVFQRLTHYVTLSGFLILAATGLLFFASHPFLNGAPARNLHLRAGIAFGLGWLLMGVTWFRDMVFARYDWGWLKHLGGYFGYRGALPSGKFNAGQKLFFWIAAVCGIVLVLTGAAMALLRADAQVNLAVWYTLHDLAALVVLVLVVAHGYCGLVLNPHCLRGIFGGRVSRTWLAEHHPQAVESHDVS